MMPLHASAGLEPWANRNTDAQSATRPTQYMSATPGDFVSDQTEARHDESEVREQPSSGHAQMYANTRSSLAAQARNTNPQLIAIETAVPVVGSD